MSDGADEPAEHVGEVARDARADQHALDPQDLQRLWAPWRFGYIAGGDRVDGCPFCVLPARGPEHDRESLIVHRGARAYVLCNAYPYNPGHLMVCPYTHVAELPELDDETSVEVWELGRRSVGVLGRVLGCDGFNLGMNLGQAAGAGIAAHLHLHVVPRWGADTNFVSTIGATRVLPRALEEVYDVLRPEFEGR